MSALQASPERVMFTNKDYLKALDKADCEDSLLRFVAKFFKLRTGNPFIVSHHHRVIVEALEQVVAGTLPNGARNLLINMPPRYGKTELAVINFVAWCLARNPAAKFIHLSYADKLALDNSSQIRDMMRQQEYIDLWPVGWKQDTDAKGLWRTQQGGGLMASPAGGTITGFGAGSTELHAYGKQFAGAIIIDDPLKPDDALSDIERGNVNDRLINTVQSRRNSRETPIILIMQRLHEDDMTGFILSGATGEKWHHIKLAALDDAGQSLWPHKHTAQELTAIKDASPYMFSGQYQQEPEPKGGGIIKREWWRKWLAPKLPAFSYVFVSVDPAYTEKQENDPSGITVWGVWEDKSRQPRIMLIFALEIRAALHELVHTIREIAEGDKKRKHSVNGFPKSELILIENKASGISLEQELFRMFGPGGWAIQMYDPRGQDKVLRAHAVSHLFSEGLVFARFAQVDGAVVARPAAALVIDQCAKFPRAKHDDLVDSTSQALRHVRDAGYLLRRAEHEEIELEKSLLRKPEPLPYDV